jgi:hypothetical protein
MVAWASSPRMDHGLSEGRPHGGQDAHRTMESCSDGSADTRHPHWRSEGPSGRDRDSFSDS